MWTNLPSKNIKGLTGLKTFPRSPAASYVIDQFSTPHDEGLQYGQRLYGFFLPPESGNYIFAASCTDECKLFLSKNADESKKDEIITHEAGSAQDQSSEAIALKGGHTYFVEALSYHDNEDSPMKVGVRLPSGNILAPISSQYLKLERGALVDEQYDKLPTPSIESMLTQRSFPDTPSRWNSLGEFSLTEKPGTSGIHGHRISGYFEARETGRHKFFGSCPSGCRLYLSADDTCNKRSLVFEYKYYPTHHDNNKRTMIEANVTTRSLEYPSLFEVSKTFDLEAGLNYYIEALQASKGDSTVKIGVVEPSGRTHFPIRKDVLTQFSPTKHGIVREVWKNVKGEELRDFTTQKNYPKIPGEVGLLSAFESPSNEKFNYGQRLKGYFVAPMTGDYKFVIACDRKCEFWMSPTEKPDHKKRMLQLNKRTPRHQFDRYPNEQLSNPIHLDIGEQYYIEALHKASTGLDHLSVGVTLPTGANEWPIPKKYLRFRPKDSASISRVQVPCKYKVNETEASKTVEGTTTQNDIALLGGVDPVSSPSSAEVMKSSDEEFDNDSTADAKVKVTHLELPFGNADSKNTQEALSIMKNITTSDKENLKIQKNDGGGFTLSGLPANLNSEEVTKIAKGVASVMKNDATQFTANTTKSLLSSLEEKNVTTKVPDVENSKLTAPEDDLKTPISTPTDSISAKGPGPVKVGDSNPPSRGTGVPKLNGRPTDSTLEAHLAHQFPVEPDIESLSVVGNLAEAAGLPQDNHIVQQRLGHAQSSQQQIAELQQSIQASFNKKPASMQEMINGDSIGASISDMDVNSDLGLQLELPASTGTNVASGTVTSGISANKRPDESVGRPSLLQQMNVREPSIGVAGSLAPVTSNEIPINKLNDYDVLNIDLEGLRRMGKQNLGLDKQLLPQKDVTEPFLAGGVEDGTLLGTQDNFEENDIDNYLTLKKKKIPSYKQSKKGIVVKGKASAEVIVNGKRQAG